LALVVAAVEFFARYNFSVVQALSFDGNRATSEKINSDEKNAKNNKKLAIQITAVKCKFIQAQIMRE